eukprot:TRINITY_DN6637_c0_g1_i1.p1 TRINITY_DN6637_c0_g1~~TRINITY_DN6637_c0_g1_i1.p1  ORF type:complete len:374 (+),score=89.09 TRINITY_DN6637_c0_g1_i1:44-1165(+)
MSIVLSRTTAYKTSQRLRKGRRDGKRFGPRLAPDGKGMFQTHSRDLKKYIEKNNWSMADVAEKVDSGLIAHWLTHKREINSPKIETHDEETGWVRYESIRTGLIGVKIGVANEVDMWGDAHKVTLVQLQDNYVLQVKTNENEPEKPNYCSLQVGAGIRRMSNVSRAMMGHFAKIDVPPKQKIVEFPVSKNGIIKAGTRLYASHFVPGQFVDVKSNSKGRGWEGVMKRWGFSGGNATHGNSKAHRSAGSTGQSQNPGRVWKGKKMSGRFGNQSSHIMNLQIIKIDTKEEILYIKGSISGKKGTWVVIKDAERKPHKRPPPYPTDFRLEQPPNVMNMQFRDPYFRDRHTDWDSKWGDARAALIAAQGKGDDGDED